MGSVNEGDVFYTVIPLSPIAVAKVGPQVSPPVIPHDTPHDKSHDTLHGKILAFCIEPRSKVEIMQYCGYKNVKNFTQLYLNPLMENKQLQMTIPDKRNSRNQKYVTVQKH